MVEKKKEKKSSPTDDEAKSEKTSEDEKPSVIDRLIERSSESARIILFASNSFLSDTVLNLTSGGMGTQYLNPVNLVKNAIDWSLADRGLLGIRGRAHYSRTLFPLSRSAQVFWEYLNYGLGTVGLFIVWLIRRWIITTTRRHYRLILNPEGV